MNFLLDTNVLVHVTNKSRGFEKITENLRQAGIERCAISALTAYELRYMILRGPGRVKKDNVTRLETFFAQFSQRLILPVTGAVAEAAAMLRMELQAKGRDIGLNDCLIAAHALHADLTCVTANRKHFDQVRSLRVVDWTAAPA